jgi:phosphotransferase system enzyme I (PtsI)
MSDKSIKITGIPASEGIGIGKAHVIISPRVRVYYQYILEPMAVKKEIERFEKALKETENHFRSLKEKFEEFFENQAYLFETYLMILKDKAISDNTRKIIETEHVNAEWALKKSLENVRQLFCQIEDPYIKSRIEDVETVVERIIRHLPGESNSGTGNSFIHPAKKRVIIVARELSPLDTTELDISKVMGFITELGGKTGHTAIVAQSLDIPAVVGLPGILNYVKDGDLLIVDGINGEVIINPDETELENYHEKQYEYERTKATITRKAHLPAITVDGRRVLVKANIEFLEEVVSAKSNGCEGIGLYRTEFLYLRSRSIPSEEELFDDYRQVVELMDPLPVTLRTLDIGGDKFASRPSLSQETNPALGLRAIRFCLKEQGIFKSQLRAILRASAYGNVRVMFPMISGLEELLAAKEILEGVKKELDDQGIKYAKDIKVGIMVEVPSAVTLADVLAPQVDFFSIGTNDLIQYALAIDRVNELVAEMYKPFHPAILRMLKSLMKVADTYGIEVSVCGEMAGDRLCIPLLIGAGIKELSMNPKSIPVTKEIIRSLNWEEEKATFVRLMAMRTAEEIKEELEKRYGIKVH